MELGRFLGGNKKPDFMVLVRGEVEVEVEGEEGVGEGKEDSTFRLIVGNVCRDLAEHLRVGKCLRCVSVSRTVPLLLPPPPPPQGNSNNNNNITNTTTYSNSMSSNAME
ncbi:hypothetical protein M0802_002367 [Mischocyttarus mexicanus]|nr:hypothetical protein M0802_002367 [Mischocyttarus mexicanus]